MFRTQILKHTKFWFSKLLFLLVLMHQHVFPNAILPLYSWDINTAAIHIRSSLSTLESHQISIMKWILHALSLIMENAENWRKQIEILFKWMVKYIQKKNVKMEEYQQKTNVDAQTLCKAVQVAHTIQEGFETWFLNIHIILHFHSLYIKFSKIKIERESSF